MNDWYLQYGTTLFLGKAMSVQSTQRPVGSSPFITAVEAAEDLRVKPATLAAMRVDGSGPVYFKVGSKRRGKVLYRAEDLDNWMKKYRFASTAEYGA